MRTLGQYRYGEPEKPARPKLPAWAAQTETSRQFPFVRGLNVKRGLPSPLHNLPMRVDTFPRIFRVYGEPGDPARHRECVYLNYSVFCVSAAQSRLSQSGSGVAAEASFQ